MPTETEYALADIAKELKRIGDTLDQMACHMDINADELNKYINRIRFGLEKS